MIITQTPLRISLAGGGTDLAAFYEIEPGCVTNSAIDKYVFVIVKERFDDKIYINYSQKEIVDSIDEIKHDLVRETMKMTGMSPGVEITTLADIPSEGSGLGSSSSVTVGLLNAFYAYLGEPQPLRVLAEQACKIEIDIIKKPIGKQDQYAAALGGLRHTQFLSDHSVLSERVKLSNGVLRKLGANILLFYTNKTRVADNILIEQKANTNGKFDVLVKMRDQAIQVRDCLEKGNLDEIGEVLHEGWQLKKSLASKITNPDIDEMYERARKAGAIGGKVAGAGGGGFLMLYVPREKQNAVRDELSDYRELPFMLERDGSKVLFNYRRYDVK
jgi:D-glycero-alpha-D-manno-heptose-7-phosphate kinase